LKGRYEAMGRNQKGENRYAIFPFARRRLSRRACAAPHLRDGGLRPPQAGRTARLGRPAVGGAHGTIRPPRRRRGVKEGKRKG
jgi:hypothetical protein